MEDKQLTKKNPCMCGTHHYETSRDGMAASSSSKPTVITKFGKSKVLTDLSLIHNPWILKITYVCD
jgi:hypothetical protein